MSSRKRVRKNGRVGKRVKTNATDLPFAEPGVQRLGSRLTLGIPDQMRVTLRGAGVTSLTSSAGALVSTFFPMNDIKSTSLSGATPAFYTEWTSMFQKFRVLASRFKIKFANLGSSSLAQSAYCVVTAEKDNTAHGSLESAAMSTYSKNTINSIQNNGFPSSDILYSMPINKILGVPQQALLTNDTYAGTSASSPATITYWGVYAKSVDGSTTTITYAFIEIEYDVLFTNRFDFVT